MSRLKAVSNEYISSTGSEMPSTTPTPGQYMIRTCPQESVRRWCSCRGRFRISTSSPQQGLRNSRGTRGPCCLLPRKRHVTLTPPLTSVGRTLSKDQSSTLRTWRQWLPSCHRRRRCCKGCSSPASQAGRPARQVHPRVIPPDCPTRPRSGTRRGTLSKRRLRLPIGMERSKCSKPPKRRGFFPDSSLAK